MVYDRPPSQMLVDFKQEIRANKYLSTVWRATYPPAEHSDYQCVGPVYHVNLHSHMVYLGGAPQNVKELSVRFGVIALFQGALF